MKPAGVIVTYMDWSDWKQWWFNIPLFVFQMVFMVVGTAIGKIELKIKKPMFVDYILAPVCLFGIVAYIVGITDGLLGGAIVLILLFFVSATLLAILTATLRGIDWRRVWRAAQVSHVRLVLEKWAPFKREPDTYSVANFGHPVMEIQPWRESWNKDNHRYFDPTFNPSPEFIAAMIQYAHDQVGKPVARKYDWLQLIFGYTANFIIWIFWIFPHNGIWWPLWGKEVVAWFNLPGYREVCISGLVACLRWGEKEKICKDCHDFFGACNLRNQRENSDYFPGYDTAVIPPCLVPINKNWRKVK